MDCYGVYYGYEEFNQNGKKNTDVGIDLGEKCIITVFPTKFEISKINPNFNDNKGNGIGFEFNKSQLNVTKREIEEGFIFKKKFYILDITISYPNTGGKIKNSIKIDKRNGVNFLTILGFN